MIMKDEKGKEWRLNALRVNREQCFVVEERPEATTITKIADGSKIRWSASPSHQVLFDWVDAMEGGLWDRKRDSEGIVYTEGKQNTEDRWEEYRRTISRRVQNGYEKGIAEIKEAGTFADWTTRRGWSG